MPNGNRKTRREIQAEMKANKHVDEHQLGVDSSIPSRKNQKSEGIPKKKKILSILFLIEAILVLILFNFIGLGIAAAMALIPFVYFLLAKRNVQKGIKRPKGSSIVFIIYFIIVLFGIRTYGILNSLVSSSQTNEFYVMAMDDDSVNSLEEIETGATMALGAETSYTTNVFPKIKFEEAGFNFNYVTYENEVDAANDLLTGNQRFIVVSNPKSKDLQSIDEFKTNTKIIGHYSENIEIQTGTKNIKKETFTILLTGVDTRSDSIDSNSRSDSIMVAKINPKTAQSEIISIPRDAYILSTCTGQYDKITHSSLNGMNCLIDDIENLLDIEIDYYMTVNFFAVIDAIDAVGGIDINVESSFCGQDEYDNLNAYCFDAGVQHLNGAEALSYARERHAFSDGDYARARHQQEVINSFLKALMTSGPFAINNLLDVASQSARTNLSASQLTDLAKVVQKTDSFVIDTYTLQGYGMSVNIPYWGLYGTSVQNIEDTSIQEAKDKLAAID